VVGSRIGGIPDFVEHGRNGLLFEPGNAAELAQHLLAFHGDRGLLGDLQRGIAPPRGLAAFTDQVGAVYEELARGTVALARSV
jgi:glycosyltransferase involved in cell wall biosynthesis